MLTQLFIRRSAELAYSYGERQPGYDRDRPGITGPDELVFKGRNSNNHVFAGISADRAIELEEPEAQGDSEPSYQVEFDPSSGETRLMIK